ncbi:Gfo/Idh/MocA family protein [Photobacterium damselae]|uniref:Gfo/Idh/MocA family protein n=1 Tax=Photobacterium damselae TaxID=38293 RepID=UPI004067A684
MIKLAVVGTNWITDQFVEAALATEQFSLKAVYSRDIQRAQEFGLKYHATHYYDKLEQLVDDTEIDAVYIASPNALHAPQAITLMQSGKHVICEKPLGSNYNQVQQMFAAAHSNNVVLFEAFMSPYQPNFQVIKDQLPSLGALRKAQISYCQYSSRYQKYLNGENPNTFNPEFSNGSIVDIGYYCVASAIELFGEPQTIKATAHLLESGVDGSGSVLLGYEGFDVVIMHSKISNSYVPSEFQGEDANLLVDMISTGRGVTKISRQGAQTDLTLVQHSNPMFYEAHAFAQRIQQGKIDSKEQHRSLIVAKVLTEIRRQTGVIFPADNIVK